MKILAKFTLITNVCIIFIVTLIVQSMTVASKDGKEGGKIIIDYEKIAQEQQQQQQQHLQPPVYTQDHEKKIKIHHRHSHSASTASTTASSTQENTTQKAPETTKATTTTIMADSDTTIQTNEGHNSFLFNAHETQHIPRTEDSNDPDDLIEMMINSQIDKLSDDVLKKLETKIKLLKFKRNPDSADNSKISNTFDQQTNKQSVRENFNYKDIQEYKICEARDKSKSFPLIAFTIDYSIKRQGDELYLPIKIFVPSGATVYLTPDNQACVSEVQKFN